jgi:hypothetical protein
MNVLSLMNVDTAKPGFPKPFILSSVWPFVPDYNVTDDTERQTGVPGASGVGAGR